MLGDKASNVTVTSSWCIMGDFSAERSRSAGVIGKRQKLLSWGNQSQFVTQLAAGCRDEVPDLGLHHRILDLIPWPGSQLQSGTIKTGGNSRLEGFNLLTSSIKAIKSVPAHELRSAAHFETDPLTLDWQAQTGNLWWKCPRGASRSSPSGASCDGRWKTTMEPSEGIKVASPLLRKTFSSPW